MARVAAKDTSRGKSDFGSRMTIIDFTSDVDLDPYARIRCNAAGNVAFVPSGQEADTLRVIAVAAGEIIPWRVRKVGSSANGTTVAAGSLMTIEG